MPTSPGKAVVVQLLLYILGVKQTISLILSNLLMGFSLYEGVGGKAPVEGEDLSLQCFFVPLLDMALILLLPQILSCRQQQNHK